MKGCAVLVSGRVREERLLVRDGHFLDEFGDLRELLDDLFVGEAWRDVLEDEPGHLASSV